MTCIIGLVDNGKVYMGADRAQSSHNWTQPTIVPKVFKNGQYLIATCGSIRMHNLLQFGFTPPIYHENEDELKSFMVNKFIKSVIELFKANSWGGDKHRPDVAEGGSFMVGVAGHLFEISSDFQIRENMDLYATNGSGAEYALGSLFSTYSHDPESRVRLALQSAAKFSPTVSEPFDILVI